MSIRHCQSLPEVFASWLSSWKAETETVAPLKRLACCILVWLRSISEIAPCKVTMWDCGPQPLEAALNGISALQHNCELWPSGQLQWCVGSMWMVSDRTQTPHTPAQCPPNSPRPAKRDQISKSLCIFQKGVIDVKMQNKLYCFQWMGSFAKYFYWSLWIMIRTDIQQ